MKTYDLIIIGAGPAGLATALTAQEAKLSCVVIDKGGIADAIRRFPVNMEFFSTTDRLEIGGVPFAITNPRPTRVEALQYYRRVAEHGKLNLSLHNLVEAIEPQSRGFRVHTAKGTFAASYVVVATGYFDHTNRLNVPGEELPHVSHYYDEPFAYADMDVVVIGGRNSATETALDLYRHGARVTVVHRRKQLGDSVKYWLLPDLQNRIAEDAIQAHLDSVVTEIQQGTLIIRRQSDEKQTKLPADFVFALIGYRPDEPLLRGAGVKLDDELIPEHDQETLETNVPGLFVAGSVNCGCRNWNIFIENGREHGPRIISHILANRSNLQHAKGL